MTVKEDDVVSPGRPENIKAVPVRHYGRWVGAAVILYIGAWAIYSVANNSRFHWDVIWFYIRDTSVVNAIGMTLELTAIAMVMGVVGGIVLAVMRLSPNPLISGVSWLYIWIFRGTPVLVQILLWGFI